MKAPQPTQSAADASIVPQPLQSPLPQPSQSDVPVSSESQPQPQPSSFHEVLSRLAGKIRDRGLAAVADVGTAGIFKDINFLADVEDAGAYDTSLEEQYPWMIDFFRSIFMRVMEREEAEDDVMHAEEEVLDFIISQFYDTAGEEDGVPGKPVLRKDREVLFNLIAPLLAYCGAINQAVYRKLWGDVVMALIRRDGWVDLATSKLTYPQYTYQSLLLKLIRMAQDPATKFYLYKTKAVGTEADSGEEMRVINLIGRMVHRDNFPRDMRMVLFSEWSYTMAEIKDVKVWAYLLKVFHRVYLVTVGSVEGIAKLIAYGALRFGEDAILEPGLGVSEIILLNEQQIAALPPDAPSRNLHIDIPTPTPAPTPEPTPTNDSDDSSEK
jgi:hypothetical protein